MNKPPLRKNVLILVCVGYGVVTVMFVAMMWPGEMTPDQAYEVVQGPLMALIGGSLAIAKDLIPLADPDSTPGAREERNQAIQPGPQDEQGGETKE